MPPTGDTIGGARLSCASRVRNRLTFALLGAALMHQAAGCDGPAPPPSEGVLLEARPCGEFSSCNQDSDCQFGTLCDQSNVISVGGNLCGGPDASAVQCRIDTGPVQSSALLNGFGGSISSGTGAVQRFDIARAENGTFSYQQPPGALVVVCALFRCAPQFASTGSRIVMSNFDTCVVSYDANESSSGVFDPSSDAYQIPAGGSPSSCATPLFPHYTQVSVGCWAYGETRLTDASPLLPVDLTVVTNIGGTGDSIRGCSSEPDGADCVLNAAEGTLGSCNQGTCAERCLDARDCEDRFGDVIAGDGAAPEGEAGADAPTGGTCPWTCVDLPNSYVGACQRTSP
jgi:hypothetical protein